MCHFLAQKASMVLLYFILKYGICNQTPSEINLGFIEWFRST